MSRLLDSLIEYFNNPENVEVVKRKIAFEEKLTKKYFDFIDKMSLEEKIILLKKIMTKYNSDKYIKREYHLGYFPRETLLYIIFDYASKYGKVHLYVKDDEHIPCESYIYEDRIIITALYGQGTKILINFLNK